MSPLRPFGTDLWLGDGQVVTAALGFRYPTRMAVLRMPQGLALWSPVAPTPDMRAAVATLGPVRHLIAPNALHNLHAAAWLQAAPDARLHAAPGFERRAPGVRVTDTLGDSPLWPGVVDQILIPNRIAPEVVLFHRPSGTVLVCDLLQGFDADWFTGWRGLVARLDGMTHARTGPGATVAPGVPRKFRLAMGRGADLRSRIARVLAWPARQVVMAHGTPVTEDAAAYLRRAFGWLPD